MQDHPDGGPPAKARSGCAVFIAIVASVLVAIPVVFSIRGLATTCQSPHAGPPWWVRQHCYVGPDQVLGTIKVCLVVIGVAVFGGCIGWLVAAGKHWPRRWPAVATGVMIAVSALYAVYIWLALASLGKWSF